MSDLDELLAIVKDRRDLPPPPMRAALRKSAGLSQDAVGAAVGATRQAVNHWEKGTRFPRPRHLHAYAELLRSLARGSQ